MKSILIVILLFLISGYSIGQYQKSGDWRWRNDDGDVYTASWKDSILTPMILNDYDNIRLRIELHNYDMDTNNIVLFYTTNRDEWNDSLRAWTKIAIEINNIDTGLFYLSNSVFLEDNNAFFNNNIMPGRNTFYQYQKTVTIESTNELMLETGKQKTIELEYCIKPSSRLNPGKTYYFMLGTYENPFNSIPPDLNENLPALIVPPVNWNFQPTGLTSNFKAICRDKNDAIWICGFDDHHYRGYIMMTTDGGANWTIQWSDSDYDVRDISFYGDYGWAVVNLDRFYGQILRTTDGGNTWNLYSKLYDYRVIFWCQFINENDGYALEKYWGGLRLLKTTNSGKTWQRYQFRSYGFETKQGFFINKDTGWFAGTQRGDIMKTTDGGLSWVELPNMHYYAGLNSVFFINENVGWAVGTQGVIFKTKDGGEHWILQTYGDDNQELTNLFFINEKRGWAIGDKGIIKITRDGGNSWFEIEAPTCNSLKDIYFIDKDNGWVVGENAVLLKTSNGGLTFVDNTASSIIITNYLLKQNYPNPFNPATKIQYDIPKVSFVTLKVYNVLGQEVATLVNEKREAGRYDVEFSAKGGLTSGVYFYRLVAGAYVSTKKLIIVR